MANLESHPTDSLSIAMSDKKSRKYVNKVESKVIFKKLLTQLEKKLKEWKIKRQLSENTQAPYDEIYFHEKRIDTLGNIIDWYKANPSVLVSDFLNRLEHKGEKHAKELVRDLAHEIKKKVAKKLKHQFD